MERSLGADVHAASVTFSVLNESGKQLRHDVVETNGQALVGYLKQIPGKLHLCIEEGEWSQWLYEILSPHGAEMVVVRREWKPGSGDPRPRSPGRRATGRGHLARLPGRGFEGKDPCQHMAPSGTEAQ